MAEADRDLDLLQLFQSDKASDNAKAYTLFIDRYKKYLKKIVQRNSSSYKNLDVDILLDESIEKIIKNSQTFDLKDAVKYKSWVSVIARNHSIDAIRKQQSKTKKAERINYLLKKQDEVKDEFFGFDDQDFKSLIAKLKSKKQREVLYLKYVNKLKYKEIAIKMVLPINTVRSHIRRGKANLKKVLKN